MFKKTQKKIVIIPPKPEKDEDFFDDDHSTGKLVTKITDVKKDTSKDHQINAIRYDNSFKIENNSKEIERISLDDEINTTHQDEEPQQQQISKQIKESTALDDGDCVQIPIVNVNLPPKDNDSTANEEQMLNYKINREKYHSFCQNQALKKEQQRKQRKERKIFNRREENEADDKRVSKSKTWKAEAASTKRILSSANLTNLLPSAETLQAVPKQSATIITKQTIIGMYQLCPSQISSLGYSLIQGEDPFFLAVYESIKADMQYARIYKLRQSNLSKIRTFIVRRVLDDFVAQRFEDSPQQREHLARHNRRITRFDRNRYVEAGIKEPPSRMKSHYLQEIFQNNQFREYFTNYISSERLKQYMIASNQQMAEKYWQQVTAIARRQLTLDQRIILFKQIKRKPLFLTQIAEYLQQANMIRIEYCKDRSKRIQSQ